MAAEGKSRLFFPGGTFTPIIEEKTAASAPPPPRVTTISIQDTSLPASLHISTQQPSKMSSKPNFKSTNTLGLAFSGSNPASSNPPHVVPSRNLLSPFAPEFRPAANARTSSDEWTQLSENPLLRAPRLAHAVLVEVPAQDGDLESKIPESTIGVLKRIYPFLADDDALLLSVAEILRINLRMGRLLVSLTITELIDIHSLYLTVKPEMMPWFRLKRLPEPWLEGTEPFCKWVTRDAQIYFTARLFPGIAFIPPAGTRTRGERVYHDTIGKVFRSMVSWKNLQRTLDHWMVYPHMSFGEKKAWFRVLFVASVIRPVQPHPWKDTAPSARKFPLKHDRRIEPLFKPELRNPLRRFSHAEATSAVGYHCWLPRPNIEPSLQANHPSSSGIAQTCPGHGFGRTDTNAVGKLPELVGERVGLCIWSASPGEITATASPEADRTSPQNLCGVTGFEKAASVGFGGRTSTHALKKEIQALRRAKASLTGKRRGCQSATEWAMDVAASTLDDSGHLVRSCEHEQLGLRRTVSNPELGDYRECHTGILNGLPHHHLLVYDPRYSHLSPERRRASRTRYSSKLWVSPASENVSFSNIQASPVFKNSISGIHYRAKPAAKPSMSPLPRSLMPHDAFESFRDKNGALSDSLGKDNQSSFIHRAASAINPQNMIPGTSAVTPGSILFRSSGKRVEADDALLPPDTQAASTAPQAPQMSTVNREPSRFDWSEEWSGNDSGWIPPPVPWATDTQAEVAPFSQNRNVDSSPVTSPPTDIFRVGDVVANEASAARARIANVSTSSDTAPDREETNARRCTNSSRFPLPGRPEVLLPFRSGFRPRLRPRPLIQATQLRNVQQIGRPTDTVSGSRGTGVPRYINLSRYITVPNRPPAPFRTRLHSQVRPTHLRQEAQHWNPQQMGRAIDRSSRAPYVRPQPDVSAQSRQEPRREWGSRSEGICPHRRTGRATGVSRTDDESGFNSTTLVERHDSPSDDRRPLIDGLPRRSEQYPEMRRTADWVTSQLDCEYTPEPRPQEERVQRSGLPTLALERISAQFPI